MKVKVPVWGYVIGIIMIFFGGCSTIQNTQKVFTPKILEMQENMMNNVHAEFETAKMDSTIISSKDSLAIKKLNKFNTIKNSLHDMVGFTDHYKRWIVIFGYIGIVLSLLYIVGGIFLMVIRRFSLKITYSVLIAYIIFDIVQMIVLSLETKSGLAVASIVSNNLFGTCLDIGLLVIILVCDKTVYRSVMKEKKII